MKRKMVNALLAAMVAASMGMSGPAVMAAAAEKTAGAEDADGETEEKVPEDIHLTLDSGEITITNKAEIVFAGAEYVKSDEKGEDDSEIWNLVLTEDGEDGEVHTFENVTPDTWTEPAVEVQFGMLYITYKNEDGTEEEALETAKEKELEEPVTVYATTDVHVRKEASTEAESLKVTALGAEWKAVAAVPGWVKVEGDGITGYIFHSYVTEDKEMVDQLVKEAEEAKAAAAAAAQAAAQQNQSQSAPAVQPQAPATQPQEPAPEPEAPYEVSRQKYDDCDGSGHGYWEITMSDGSVVIEEY